LLGFQMFNYPMVELNFFVATDQIAKLNKMETKGKIKK
jgi:hypothetical protein